MKDLKVPAKDILKVDNLIKSKETDKKPEQEALKKVSGLLKEAAAILLKLHEN